MTNHHSAGVFRPVCVRCSRLITASTTDVANSIFPSQIFGGNGPEGPLCADCWLDDERDELEKIESQTCAKPKKWLRNH